MVKLILLLSIFSLSQDLRAKEASSSSSSMTSPLENSVTPEVEASLMNFPVKRYEGYERVYVALYNAIQKGNFGHGDAAIKIAMLKKLTSLLGALTQDTNYKKLPCVQVFE